MLRTESTGPGSAGFTAARSPCSTPVCWTASPACVLQPGSSATFMTAAYQHIWTGEMEAEERIWEMKVKVRWERKNETKERAKCEEMPGEGEGGM